MRITENGFADQYLNTIGKTRERLTTLQTQIASGKRVAKVSDDPQGANYIMRLKAQVSANDQYSKNVTDAQSVMETTMSSLNDFSDILAQVKEIIARATNATSSAELPTYGQSIDQLLDEAVNYANTQYNGKFIFAGTNTLQAPFTMAVDRSAVTANPNGITGNIEYKIGEGVNQKVNIDGQQAFQGTAIFNLLIQLRDNLNSGHVPATTDARALDAAYQQMLTQTSLAGSITDQMSQWSSHLDAQKNQLLGLLSVQADTDIAEATVKMQQEQMNLEVALNVTAQILPKTLLTYLTTSA